EFDYLLTIISNNQFFLSLLLSSVYEHKNIILKAMDKFHSMTCIRFIPYNNSTDTYYTLIKKGEKFSTLPGINTESNVTTVTLDLDKEYGYKTRFRAITHELAHVVGLFHEHQRPDRDNFIETIQKNCLCTLLINNSDWNCKPYKKIIYYNFDKNVPHLMATINEKNIPEWFNHHFDQKSITYYPDCFTKKDYPQTLATIYIVYKLMKEN
ncbi:hypothetical protein BLA29_008747, partial [Euroglyphus maynei]